MSPTAPKGAHTLNKKHPLAIRWFHWINFPLLAVMIWSGLLIYWANDVYGVRFGNKEIVQLLPDKAYNPPAPGFIPRAFTDEPAEEGQARTLYTLSQRLWTGMGWHFLFMWFFTINGILYVLYTAFSGQWRYLVPQKGTLKHALQTVLHDLHLAKEPPRQKFNGAQQIAYTMIIIMGLGSVLTGLAIYKPTQLAWLTNALGGYGAARFFHFWLMVFFVLFFLIHILQVIRAGWNNFRAMVCGYELVPLEETH